MTLLPIPIPQGYQITVEKDQKVSQGDVLASGSQETPTSNAVIHVAADLGSDPRKTEKLLVKKPGERIEAGDLVAKKGGVFGSRELRSKVSGTISSFDPSEGSITIISDNADVEKSDTGSITSPVDGQVDSCDNDKVVLKTDKEAVLANSASGKNSFGEVFYFEKGDLDSEDISSDVSGKILIAKSLTREAVSKAIGLSCIGVVGIDISDSTFEDLKSKHINTPVLRLSEGDFKKIAKKNEKLMLDSENSVIIKL